MLRAASGSSLPAAGARFFAGVPDEPSAAGRLGGILRAGEVNAKAWRDGWRDRVGRGADRRRSRKRSMVKVERERCGRVDVVVARKTSFDLSPSRSCSKSRRDASNDTATAYDEHGRVSLQ
jgi:hypothetical protein